MPSDLSTTSSATRMSSWKSRRTSRAMSSPTKWQTRKTLIDLYTDRDRTKWFWRLLGTLSSSLIFLGFLVFPASFPTSSNPQSSSTLSIVAVILLALGYSLSVALWFICTSWLFQFDVVFVPCLTACILGSVNIGISLGIYSPSPVQWSATPIAALTLGLLSSLIYAGISIFTYRKISFVRSKDKTAARHGSETLTLLPEDEQQRQQLLRLLLQKEHDRSSPVTSSSTFRIDIPDNAIASTRVNFASSHVENSELSYLAAPSATYESRGRSTLPIDDQFNVARGSIPEPIDRRQQALEAARQRTAANNAQRSRDSSTGGPPVIINSRAVGDDISEIPLSERHPLERSEFVRGRNSKEENEIYHDGVYRPEDHDEYDDEEEEEDYDEGPTYEIVEGERIQVDLEAGFRRPRELEAESSQRREIDTGAPGPSRPTPGRHFNPSPQEWATL